MANLYQGEMAAIFDAMYQTFIDYDEEYHFYNTLIQEYHAQTILEIGSGTGNLAKRFKQNKQQYTGLDSSKSMIDIAQTRNPKGLFIHGDMRDFTLEKKVDAILITGRSTSYLTSNDDIYETFDSIYKSITQDGILIFDFIDANRFIPFIKNNKMIIHEAAYKGINYIRESSWETTTLDNIMLEWHAKYYTIVNNKKEVIFNDYSTVRVFTLNEIQIYLYLNGFEIIKTIDRKTYAYDTYVIVAKKRK